MPHFRHRALRSTGHASDEDHGEWLAKFLLALAEDRVRSVFDRSGEPHWPDWMEDDG
jgi:hypothetical protein